MKQALHFRRFGSSLLALVVCLTQGAMAYQPEKNFWDDRRQATARRASAPCAWFPSTVSVRALTAQFPDAKSVSPLLSSSVATLPSPFLADEADILSALSFAHGTIRGVFLPKVNSSLGPVVIHIQDVHMNAEAQWNIREAVGSLLKTGRVTLLGLEGATGEIDLQPFVDYPRRKPVEMAADFLLRENKISGPIHAALTGRGKLPRILGIEDPAHYEANVKAYRDSAPKLDATKQKIKGVLHEIESLKSAIFPPSLQGFDRNVQSYREGRMSLGDYVQILARTASPTPSARLFLEALAMEQTLDFKQVESERTRLIERLTQTLTPEETRRLVAQSLAYRSGELRYAEFYGDLKALCESKGIKLAVYPALDAYVRYVLLADRIDAERLLCDIAVLEKTVYAQEAKTPEQQALVARSRRLWLTSKLVDFSLTPEEWKEYVGGPIVDADLDLSSFEAFYQQAHARDSAMAVNLLAGLEKNKQKKPPIVILVTGGFHAAGMTEKLTQAGAAVISYVPKIEKIDTAQGAGYLSVFTQEKTPLEKLFAGQKLFLANSPFSEVTRLRLAFWTWAGEMWGGRGKTSQEVLTDLNRLKTHLKMAINQWVYRKGVLSLRVEGREIPVISNEGKPIRSIDGDFRGFKKMPNGPFIKEILLEFSADVLAGVVALFTPLVLTGNKGGGLAPHKEEIARQGRSEQGDLGATPIKFSEAIGNFTGKVFSSPEAKLEQMVTQGVRAQVENGQIIFTGNGRSLYTKKGALAIFPLANYPNGTELWEKAKRTLLVYLEKNEEIKKYHPDFCDFVKEHEFNLQIIDDNDYIQGYSDGTIMCLTPWALNHFNYVFHELGEAYFASGSTHAQLPHGVLAHTYLRGAGRGVIRSLGSNLNGTPDGMIGYLEKEGVSRSDGSRRSLTGSEAALIRFNDLNGKTGSSLLEGMEEWVFNDIETLAWKTSESEHFIFHFFPDSKAERDIEIIRRSRESVIQRLENEIGLKFPEGVKIVVYLFPGKQEAVWHVVGFASRTVHGPIISVAWPDSERHFEEVKPGHEVTHSFQQMVGPWRRGFIRPFFFREGMAEYYSGDSEECHVRLASIIQSGSEPPALPLRQLILGGQENVNSPAAGSFYQFLVEKGGAKKAWDLFFQMSQINSGGSSNGTLDVFESKVMDLYGVNGETLEREWHQKVREVVQRGISKVGEQDDGEIRALFQQFHDSFATTDSQISNWEPLAKELRAVIGRSPFQAMVTHILPAIPEFSQKARAIVHYLVNNIEYQATVVLKKEKSWQFEGVALRFVLPSPEARVAGNKFGALIPVFEPFARWVGATVLHVPKRFQETVYRLVTAPALEEPLAFLLGMGFDLIFPGLGGWSFGLARGVFFGGHFIPRKGESISWGRILAAGIVSSFHGLLLWGAPLAPVGLMMFTLWLFHVGVNAVGLLVENLVKQIGGDTSPRSTEQWREAGRWVAKYILLDREVGPPPVVGSAIFSVLGPAANELKVGELDRPSGRGETATAEVFYDELRDRLSAGGGRLNQVDSARFLNALLALSTGHPTQLDDPVAHLSLTGPEGIAKVRQMVALLEEMNRESKNPIGLFVAAATSDTWAALAPLEGPNVKVVDASGTLGRVDMGKMAVFEQWAAGRARGGRLSLSVSRSPHVELCGLPQNATGWVAKVLEIIAGKDVLASQEFLLFLRSVAHLRRMA